MDFTALADFTRALIRTPSVLGNEEAMANAVAARMRQLRFDHVEIDACGNALGVIAGGTDGPTILFDAHMDTVDVMPRDKWTHDPFGGERVGSRIFGRGASDMKAALAAMVYAAAGLERSKLAGRVVVSGSVGEESIEGAALREVMKRYPPDFVVIGESSELNLVRAGRGRAEFRIRAMGKPSHASTPDQGTNAVERMMRILGKLAAIRMPEPGFVDGGVLCVTDIISDPYPGHSVVPSGCVATIERRLVPGDTLEQCRDDLQNACKDADAGDTQIELARIEYRTWTGVTWDQKKWLPPWELAESHGLVQRSLAALRKTGLNPKLTSYRFCTNAAYSAGEAGVATVGFGPSTERLAHVTDEYIEIDQLEGACRGYAAIATEMLARS